LEHLEWKCSDISKEENNRNDNNLRLVGESEFLTNNVTKLFCFVTIVLVDGVTI
jgi:hypothetical protein